MPFIILFSEFGALPLMWQMALKHIPTQYFLPSPCLTASVVVQWGHSSPIKRVLLQFCFHIKKKKLQRALVQKIQNALNSRLAQDSSGAYKTAARNQVSGKEVQVLSKYKCEVQTWRAWWHCCCHGGHPQLQTTLGAIKCICPLIGSL